MATFTVTVSSPVLGATLLGQTITIADTDLQSLLTYLVAKYTPRRGNAAGAAPTPQAALTTWLAQLVNSTKSELARYQTAQAKAAVAAVAPVAVTMAPVVVAASPAVAAAPASASAATATPAA